MGAMKVKTRRAPQIRGARAVVATAVRGEGTKLGHENRVNDVNDTVGLEDVRGSDSGHAAFGIGDHDDSTRLGEGEGLAFDGGEGGFTAALLDVFHDLL